MPNGGRLLLQPRRGQGRERRGTRQRFEPNVCTAWRRHSDIGLLAPRQHQRDAIRCSGLVGRVLLEWNVGLHSVLTQVLAAALCLVGKVAVHRSVLGFICELLNAIGAVKFVR